MSESRNNLSIIVAVDQNGGYATRKGIPWSFTADWDHFKKITEGHVCVMGRRTYEDIADRRRQKTPKFKKLLPKRDSFVLSRSLKEAQGAVISTSVPQDVKDGQEIFLLGGFHVWMQYWNSVNTIWMTIVPGTYDTTKKFPVHWINDDFNIVEGRKEQTDDGEILFVRYLRKGTTKFTKVWK